MTALEMALKIGAGGRPQEYGKGGKYVAGARSAGSATGMAAADARFPNGANPERRFAEIISGTGKGRPSFSEGALFNAAQDFRRFIEEDPPLTIRISGTLLSKLAADGQFKTQHDTGFSAGSYSPSMRDDHELNMFGVEKTRPIYGYVQDQGGLTSHAQIYYGEVVVVLKPGVKDRTTLTWEDSLNISQPPAPIPYRDVTTAIDSRIGAAISSEYGLRRPGYVEAQIHGGVTIDDISHFEVHVDNARRPLQNYDKITGDRFDDGGHVRLPDVIIEDELARLFPGIETRIVGSPGMNETFSVIADGGWIEFYNDCHNRSDGRFCGVSGGARRGAGYDTGHGYGPRAMRDVALAGVKIAYSPKHPDGGPDPGEVVWARVPFADDPTQSKDRPVLVIGRVNSTGTLAVVQLTSKTHGRKEEMPIGPNTWSKNDIGGNIKLDRIIQVDPSNYRREGGVLPRAKFDEVIGRLSAYHRRPIQEYVAGLLEFYNKNHDTKGRFSSGRFGSTFGGMSADPNNRTRPISKVTRDDFTKEGMKALAKKLYGSDADVDTVFQSQRDDRAYAVISGRIRNKFGDVVGNFERTIELHNGVLSVNHKALAIDDVYQNRGLGAAWNKNAVDQYRELGVDSVMVHAAERVGGYAWAREGFRIYAPPSSGLTPGVDAPWAGSRQGMRDLIQDKVLPNLERMKEFGRITDPQFDEARKSVDALIKANEAGEDVQPIHVASIGEDSMRYKGETTQGGTYDTWPGKEMMLGTDWQGVYFFDAGQSFALADAEEFYNKNHDKLGRFAPRPGGAVGQAIQAARGVASGGTPGKTKKVSTDTPFGRSIRAAIDAEPALDGLSRTKMRKQHEEESARQRQSDEEYQSSTWSRPDMIGNSIKVLRTQTLRILSEKEDFERDEFEQAVKRIETIMQPGYKVKTNAEQVIIDAVKQRQSYDVYSDILIPMTWGAVRLPGVSQSIPNYSQARVNADTEIAVRKIGTLIDNEINKRLSQDWDPMAGQKQHRKAMEEIAAVLQVPAASVQRYMRIYSPDRALVTTTSGEGIPRGDPRHEAIMAITKRYGIQNHDVNTHLRVARELVHSDTINAVIGEVRAMGGKLAGTPRLPAEPKTEAQNAAYMINKQVTGAVVRFPEDWISASNVLNSQKLTFDQSFGARAFYSQYGGKQPRTALVQLDGSVASATHELTHRMEYSVPGMKALEAEFFRRRTEGEQSTPLGPPYGETEIHRPDNFFTKYVGRDYGGEAWEIMSMGTEHLHKTAGHASMDADYRSFVLGTLVTLYRE